MHIHIVGTAGHSQLLAHSLAIAGFEVKSSDDPGDGEQLAIQFPPELVILDATVIGLSESANMIARIRRSRSEPAIGVLVADDTPERCARLLDIGADSYQRCPYRTDVMVSWSRALARRSRCIGSNVITASRITVDIVHRRVIVSGKQIKLTKKEYDLLESLIAASGTIVDRESLSLSGWGCGDYADPSNLLNVYIGRLRRKLDSAGVRNVIESVRREGYRIV